MRRTSTLVDLVCTGGRLDRSNFRLRFVFYTGSGDSPRPCCAADLGTNRPCRCGLCQQSAPMPCQRAVSYRRRGQSSSDRQYLDDPRHGLSHATSLPATIWKPPGNWCASSRRSTRTWKRPRSSAACSRRAGRRSTYATCQGCRFPMVSNLFGTMERVRYIFRDSLDAVRQLVELKVDPADVLRAAAGAMLRPAAGAVAHAAARVSRAGRCWRTKRRSTNCRSCSRWPDDGGAFITLPQVYTEDPDRPGWRAVEPGHVSRAAFRRAVRAEPRGRAALSDPSRHRRASRGGAAPRRAAAGERLRRRAAGDDRGRRDAAARGHERTGVRRRAGRAARADDLPRRANCRSTPRPISASPARSIPTGNCPKARSAITWATTAWRTIFRCCGSSTSIIAPDAIWPFTVVGRPPQEDTIFGQLIHELTGPVDSDA